MGTKPIRTRIATSDAGSITIRGHDLVDELMGRRTFVEMLYAHVCQRFPTTSQARLLDACLVTVMEHGMTPSSLIARIAADSAPDQLQIAVASGLLAVGDVFVGTMEGCGAILQAGVHESDRPGYCERVVDEYLKAGRKVPGFGHPFHKPDDPRTAKLIELARAEKVDGQYIELLLELGKALDLAGGRHQTINATGAIAALFLEIQIPVDIFRGLAMVARCAGLLGHVQEERRDPAARTIWKLVEANTEYLD